MNNAQLSSKFADLEPKSLHLKKIFLTKYINNFISQWCFTAIWGNTQWANSHYETVDIYRQKAKQSCWFQM